MLVVLSGCGSTGRSEPTDGGTTPPPPTVDEMPDPGHVIGKGGNDPDAPDQPTKPTPVTGHGFVTMRTVPIDGTTLSAAFWNGPDVDDGLDSDGCRLGRPPTVPEGATLLDAGDIDIFSKHLNIRLEFGGPAKGYEPKSIERPAADDATFVSAFALSPATVPDFGGRLEPMPEPSLVTSADDGVEAASSLSVAWQSIPKAARFTVVLEGAITSVACVVPGTATELAISAARVQAVTSHPKMLGQCPSCVTLTVEARSEVVVTAGKYAVALRDENARSVTLAVK